MEKTPEDIELLERKIAALRQKEGRGGKKSGDSEFVRASRLGLRIGAELLSA